MDKRMGSSKCSWAADVEPRVAVVGIGGAGCNIVSDIHRSGDSSLETIAINMDRRSLSEAAAHRKISICQRVTRGEGAKGDPELGRSCGKAHRDEIEAALADYDVVFLVAGMGGGTGSGACPVVADICRRLNLITFAVLVNPFSFERPRIRVAREGVRRMRQSGCLTVVVENDMLLRCMPDSSMEEAFEAANRSVHSYILDSVGKVRRSFIDQMDEIEDMVQESGSEKTSGLLSIEAVRIS